MPENIIRADEVTVNICKALGLDPNRVRRIVLDLNVGQPVTAYVEMYGDARFLEIKWELGGAKVEFSAGGMKSDELYRAYLETHRREMEGK